MDCFDLLEVQGTLKILLQHHSSKASVLWCSAFFMVQLSHLYMTTGKTIALTGFLVQFSRSVVSDSLRPHGLQHSRPPCHHQLPESTQTHVHRVGDAIQTSHPLSPPSPHSFNLSQHQSFSMNQLFASSGQSTGASASTSVLPVNTQD